MEKKQLIRDEKGGITEIITTYVPSFRDARTGVEHAATGFSFFVMWGNPEERIAAHPEPFLDPVAADELAKKLIADGVPGVRLVGFSPGADFVLQQASADTMDAVATEGLTEPSPATAIAIGFQSTGKHERL